MTESSIASMREQIARTYEVIRPYIRRTPVVDVDAADFGLDPLPLVLKLELMQHTGSFKTRGAFSNLLTRAVPAAGVVAASGGNHGVAVAYAAKQAGKAARIFVPTVSSPAKMDRIRSYGAELVVGGERYNDALIASEEWARESGAMAVHAYDQMETLWGAGSVGLEFEEQAPADRYAAGGVRRRRIDRGNRRVVPGAGADCRSGAGEGADAVSRAGGRAARWMPRRAGLRRIRWRRSGSAN